MRDDLLCHGQCAATDIFLAVFDNHLKHTSDRCARGQTEADRTTRLRLQGKQGGFQHMGQRQRTGIAGGAKFADTGKQAA